jgi:hypothetical protein
MYVRTSKIKVVGCRLFGNKKNYHDFYIPEAYTFKKLKMVLEASSQRHVLVMIFDCAIV